MNAQTRVQGQYGMENKAIFIKDADERTNVFITPDEFDEDDLEIVRPKGKSVKCNKAAFKAWVEQKLDLTITDWEECSNGKYVAYIRGVQKSQVSDEDADFMEKYTASHQ